tara:strand:- start:183 stop:1031 length:849 start_codon:yes stop_codon:yes gene_type:complete
MYNIKSYIIIFALSLLVSTFSISSPVIASEDSDKIIADVDGNPITLAELKLAISSLPADYQDMAKTSLSQMMLQQLIDLKILSAKADEENITSKKSYKNELSFLIDQLKREHYLRNLYAKNVKEDTILARYKQLVSQLDSDKEIRARHILLKTKEEAESILVELSEGADFSQLASQKSIGPSASNGGDLGFFTRESMVPDFSQVAFALTPGEVSKPVKTKFGWHVIKLEEIRPSTAPDFNLVKDELRDELERMVMTSVIGEARRSAVINIRESNLSNLLIEK